MFNGVEVKPLPGYKDVKPFVYAGFFRCRMRIIPHATVDEDRRPITELRKQLFDARGWEYVTLDDDSVYVVDNNYDYEEVLR